MPVFDVIEESTAAKAHQEKAVREQEAAERQAQARRQAEGPPGLAAAQLEAARVAAVAQRIAEHHSRAEAEGRAFVAKNAQKVGA